MAAGVSISVTSSGAEATVAGADGAAPWGSAVSVGVELPPQPPMRAMANIRIDVIARNLFIPVLLCLAVKW